MKKLAYSLLLCALLLAAALVPSMAEGADAVSSASVADFYGAAALTGDELMDAINSFSGFYLVSTTNPDGTPNSAYFIYAMRKHEDKYYIQLGLAENQSKQNLLANGEGLAVYAATPSTEEGAKPYADCRSGPRRRPDARPVSRTRSRRACTGRTRPSSSSAGFP